jgi:Meckel syndrome type 1 protein
VAVEPAAAPVAAQPEPATAAPEVPKAAKRAKARTPRSKKPAAPEAAQVAAEATPAAQSPATFVAPESGSLEERVNARMAAAAKTLADTPAPTARCGVTQPAQPAAAAAPAPAPVPASAPQPAATPAAEGAPAGKQINLFGF